MAESLRPINTAGKGRAETEFSHPTGENPETSPTLDSDSLRRRFADAYRRATWWIADVVAAALGLKRGTVGKWTAGERRSPGESVYLTTMRSLREGTDRENAVAIVVELAKLILTASEMEEMAAEKRADEEPSVSNLRRIRRDAEAERDRLETQGIVDVLAVRREIRRGRRVFDEIETEMDRAVSAQEKVGPTAENG